MPGNRCKTAFSLGEKIGFIALTLGLLLFFLAPSLAFWPLIVFLILCFGAPFFPRLGFYLPVISRGKDGSQEVALTFDDGPSPLSTPILLDLLARHRLPATFFVVGEKALKHPELIQRILDNGHTIGNHSWNHDYFLMLRSTERLQMDVHETQEIFKQFGVKPAVFRPPVGITGPRLGRVLKEEGLTTVNYSCRAFDGGNRNIENLAGKILNRIKAGAIIMLHDLPPEKKNLEDSWQNEIDFLFTALQKRYTIASLEQLIKQPVMKVLQ